MFLIFLIPFWIFQKTSKFWAASCKKKSNLLLIWITVCIESFFPIGWHTFIWWKNPPKCCSILVCIAECWSSSLSSRNPKNNWCPSRIFLEHGSAKKIAVWAHANRDPNKQEDSRPFCMKWLRTLKLFQIFRTKIKKSKTYSGLYPFQGLSNGTPLMQIQSGRTVPLKVPSGQKRSAWEWYHWKAL